jgi:hypothetical protein
MKYKQRCFEYNIGSKIILYFLQLDTKNIEIPTSGFKKQLLNLTSIHFKKR